MKKRALALILSVATALTLLTACGGSTGASSSGGAAGGETEATAEAGEAVESTIYPTPEGVSYTAIAEGKSAPDWT